MKNANIAIFCRRKLNPIFMVLIGSLILSSNLIGQQLEIDWDGSEADVLKLIEGGKMRFSIEGHTASTPDRITFKIRSGDTLINALTLYEGGFVRLERVDTIVTGAANAVRLADGTLGVRVYKIGDMAHGGIVFWVDETGEHGLVSDTSDIASPTNVSDLTHQWSTTFEDTGATGDGIGTGAMNTLLIVSAQRGDKESAARLCADLEKGGYGDWYLPSKEETYLMYKNLHRYNCSAAPPGGSDVTPCPTSLGDFAPSFYWSSSEFDDNDAWTQVFVDGVQVNVNKLGNVRVRAIRAF